MMMIELLTVIVIMLGVLISVALMTVVERKYLSSIQRRRGPNVIGLYGVLQAIGDGVKLIVKETVKPSGADSVKYMMAPVITFTVSIGCWSILPLGEGEVLADLDVGILYVLGISSVGVYGVLLGGYSSNSKYGFYGGVRSSGQMISYEVSIGFIIGVVCMKSGGGLNVSELVIEQEMQWNAVGLLPMFILFMVSILAETNRHPFDLPEAESELVSGYNVEYSGGGFALFFLGEYSSIILMSALCVNLFMGGWSDIGSSIKIVVIILVFIWARAGYPRYRYDQLMTLGWRSILTVSIGWVLWLTGLMVIS